MDKSTTKAEQQSSLATWTQIPGRWLNFKDISIGLVLTTLLINTFSLTLPLFIYQVYDHILPNATTDALTSLAILAGVLIVISAFLKLIRQYVLLWSETKFDHALATSAFEKIINTHPAALQKHQIEKYLHLLQSGDDYKRVSQYKTITMSIDIPFYFIYLGIIASFSLSIASFLVCIQGIFVLIFLATSKDQALLSKYNQAAKQEKNSLINQMIEGIHTLKALGIEAFYLRKLDNLANKEVETHYLLDQIQGHKNRLLNISRQYILIITVSIGCLLVMQNKITLGALVICVLLSDSSLYLLHRWIEWFNQSQRQKSMMNHLQGLYSLPQEHEMIINSKDIESQIDLVSVGSRDALTGFWVLKDIHLSIKSGETIAISSQNQAASSQLLKIMAGILPPTQGHVLISNQDLYGDYLHTLRSHIAYLPHHGTLFAGTILDNITMFRNSQLAKEAKQIANKLGLDTLINTLPMGYQTHVGFGASDHIAKGIKQLIIIARGLIGNPKIILFDEANTALDQMADEHLRHYLNECKKHITIVLVSHRSSFLALVDKTLVLDQIKTSVIESSEVA